MAIEQTLIDAAEQCIQKQEKGPHTMFALGALLGFSRGNGEQLPIAWELVLAGPMLGMPKPDEEVLNSLVPLYAGYRAGLALAETMNANSGYGSSSHAKGSDNYNP